MTTKEAQHILDTTESDLDILNPIGKGFSILAKYDEDISCQFEHDQMWAADFEKTVQVMSKEDVIQMGKLGWFEDEDAWSHF